MEPHHGSIQSTPGEDHEQKEGRLASIFGSKKPSKGLTKAFSFGTTHWENSIKFKAGQIDGQETPGKIHAHHDEEIHSLLPQDKTDVVGAGSVKTFVNIVKSFVGTGILFLPSAFRDGGIVFSAVVLLAIALVTLAGMLLLVSCWEKERGSFGDIAERALGKPGRILVDSCLVLAQLSFGCVYMVFIAETFLQVIGKHGEWHLAYAVLMEIPILTPLVWIRHVYKLSLANFVGTLCVVLGAMYILVFNSVQLGKDGPGDNIEYYFNSKGFALFLGTAIFTFEGIGTVIPIQQSMKEKHKFRMLLTSAILSILVVLMVFAIIGYLTHGDLVLGPITKNLPNDKVGAKVVLSLYTVAVLFSYPLIVFPAVEILSKLAFKEGPVTTERKWKKNFFRFVIVCLTAGIAIGGGSDFEKFVSLVGGFACTPLGFIFPALFHYKLVATTSREKAFDIFVGILGIIMGVFATSYSMYSWIDSSRG